VVWFIIISISAGRCGVTKTNSSVRLREGSDVLDGVGKILNIGSTRNQEINENMLDGTRSMGHVASLGANKL